MTPTELFGAGFLAGVWVTAIAIAISAKVRGRRPPHRALLDSAGKIEWLR